MSRRGDCHDNAVMDCFSTVTFELADRFERRDDAQRALFVYIEVVDNQRHRHSTIDDVSPAIEQRARSAEMSER